MKKIICPTDFSSTANNAIQYAAKIAQLLNAEMEIINVQFISSVSPLSSGIMVRERTVPAIDKLKKICVDVDRTYNIACRYNVEIAGSNLEKAIADKLTKDDLLVIGTNGADDLYQYVFGTNSYHVVKKSKCPVLIVPEGISYVTADKIVFAWDYSLDNAKAVSQMKEVSGKSNPEITFLHISNEKTAVSDEVFRSSRNEVDSLLGEKEKISFERIYCDETELLPEKLDEYMDDSQADLLAVTFYDRGVLKNAFHGTIIKRLCEIIEYPLLVLHAND